MTDLNGLYKDWIDKRLAWQTVRRDKEEALLKGIVDEIEALKASSLTWSSVPPAFETRRGPGRPPKVEAAP